MTVSLPFPVLSPEPDGAAGRDDHQQPIPHQAGRARQIQSHIQVLVSSSYSSLTFLTNIFFIFLSYLSHPLPMTIKKNPNRLPHSSPGFPLFSWSSCRLPPHGLPPLSPLQFTLPFYLVPKGIVNKG
jgi:hypothetical protein